jgi:hypothetical protein
VPFDALTRPLPGLTSLAALVFAIGGHRLPAHRAATGQTSCATAAHRQFDFWVGEWDVIEAGGQRAGTNRIEKVLDGCALHETWTSAGPVRGNSYSAWDAGDNRWHQSWVDNAGTVLRISGGIVNGEMVMEGDRRLPDGTPVTDRITWTPDADGTVRQLWQASRDRGMRWTVVFDGTYRRRPRD